MPSRLTWAITCVVTKTFTQFVIKYYVLNECKGSYYHTSMADALHATIMISIWLQGKHN